MGYKMKNFSGFGNSPAKQRQKSSKETLRHIAKFTEPGLKRPGFGERMQKGLIEALETEFTPGYRMEKKEGKGPRATKQPSDSWAGSEDRQGWVEHKQNKAYKGLKSDFKYPAPTKQQQGFGGKQLIKAQENLAQQELAFHQPGWARVATSMMVGNDPSAGAKKSKKSGVSTTGDGKSDKKEGTGGGFGGAADDIQSGIDEWGNIKEKWGDVEWGKIFSK